MLINATWDATRDSRLETRRDEKRRSAMRCDDVNWANALPLHLAAVVSCSPLCLPCFYTFFSALFCFMFLFFRRILHLHRARSDWVYNLTDTHLALMGWLTDNNTATTATTIAVGETHSARGVQRKQRKKERDRDEANANALNLQLDNNCRSPDSSDNNITN